jgi:hypothetical protein
MLRFPPWLGGCRFNLVAIYEFLSVAKLLPDSIKEDEEEPQRVLGEGEDCPRAGSSVLTDVGRRRVAGSRGSAVGRRFEDLGDTTP